MSYGQVQIQRVERNRLHLLKGGAAKSHCKGLWIQGWQEFVAIKKKSAICSALCAFGEVAFFFLTLYNGILSSVFHRAAERVKHHKYSVPWTYKGYLTSLPWVSYFKMRRIQVFGS